MVKESKKFKNFANWFRNNWIALVALIISGIALHYTRIANNVSENANIISTDASNYAKKIGEMQNRPWLSFKFVPFSKKGNMLWADNHGDTVRIYGKLILINSGSTPAKNIKLSVESSFGNVTNANKDDDSIFRIDGGNTILGIRDTLWITCPFQLNADSQNRGKLEQILKKNDLVVIFKTVVEYKGLISDSLYYTSIDYKLFGNNHEIIGEARMK